MTTANGTVTASVSPRWCALGGLVPSLVNPGFAHSELGLWQSSLVSAILGLCLPCLVLVILVDWRLRPEHPDGARRRDGSHNPGSTCRGASFSMPSFPCPSRANAFCVAGEAYVAEIAYRRDESPKRVSTK